MSKSAPIRVGIVNDLKLATQMLSRIIASDPALVVAWSAVDGEQAISRCVADRPDILLMDLIMPRVDGVEATRRIMAEAPCPILIVTATVSGNLDQVYEALGEGACDAVVTPTRTDGAEACNLLRKIRVIQAAQCTDTALRPAPDRPTTRHVRPPIVGIGASTGGPAAIQTVLSGLASGFSAAVVIAQHMDEAFIGGFVGWLDSRVALPVVLAQQDELPQPGRVYVADCHAHLRLNADRRFDYFADPEMLYVPSADLLFASLARVTGPDCVGVLLTGLGRDGANGLLAMRQAGCETVAQDRESSVVYGMPGAAAEVGAACSVLALDRIAASLNELYGAR
jgi:two-component system response regulator WspF